jgi:ornithine decarboxylase
MSATIARPRKFASAEDYARWRKDLWSTTQRGPNSASDQLLPCYKHALKCTNPNPHHMELPAGKTAARAQEAAKADASEVERQRKLQVARAASGRVAASREALVEAMLRGVTSGQHEPFYLVDLDAALEKLAQWRAMLPNIVPHYAVKCNGDPALLLTLASEGVGFDCASQAELQAVLSLGVPASRVVYANPVKQPSHIKWAAEHGAALTVFDGEEELRKMAPHRDSLELLLRLAVDDSSAQCVLSNKFGAPPADVPQLLATAAELGLRVVGVSFHVGSGSRAPDTFRDAVERAAAVFSLAESRGTPMRVLDVGGGFPGADTPEFGFADMAGALRDALADHFPPERDVRIIAEPGRFFAASTHTLAVSVIGKKTFLPSAAPKKEDPSSSSDGDGEAADGHSSAEAAGEGSGAASAADRGRIMYYINDGLYGSFNCVLYDHAEVECHVLPSSDAAAAAVAAKRAGADSGPPCSVWGPTCDGIDCVLAEDLTLPTELPVGSWLYFPDMGAYTRCAGSNFNGMATPDVLYLQGRGSGEARPRAPAVAAAHMLRQLRSDGVTAA